MKAPKHPILDTIEVPQKVIETWQETSNLLAEIAGIPAALVMRVHAKEIEVFVSSHCDGNVFHHGEKAPLDTGLYCETVIGTRRELLVPNALNDPAWDHNPDIERGMISYLGLPLVWPTGEIFGTICILDKKENAYSQRIRFLMERMRDSIQFSLQIIHTASTEREQAEAALRRAHDELEIRVQDQIGELASANASLLSEISERKVMEEALAHTVDRLRLATRAGGVGIWDWDIAKNQLTWDDQMYRLYGITREQFGGAYEAWAAGIHPEDKVRGDAEIQMALRGEKEFDTEFRVLWPDGTTCNIRALAVVQRDASGKPLHMIGTNWDVTNRILAERQRAEALERAMNLSQHHQTILRTAMDGFVLVDAQGSIREVNDAYCVMVGYSEQELLAMGIFDLEASESREESHAHIQKVTAKGQDRFESRHRRKDGKFIDVEVSVQLRSTDGSMAAFIRDITERKATEAKIKRLSMLYAALSETSQAIVRSKSADELLERVCRIVVEQGEMKLAWVGMADTAGKVRVQAAYGPGIEYLSGIEVSSNAGDPQGRGPTGTAIREGKPYWCHSFLNDSRTTPWHERAARFSWKSTAAIPLRLRGKTIGALTIYDDLSEVFDDDVRRLFVEMEKTIGFALDYFANEEELKRTEARFRKFFDLPLNGTCITSPEKGWMEVNDRLCAMLGYSREEILSRTWAEMTHPEDLAADVAQFDRILSGEIEQYKLEKRFIRKDGAVIWAEISVGCVRKSDGAVDYCICVLEDISERKAMEGRLNDALHRAEAGSRTKSEFLAIMSHELRTPLNGVLGFAELLSDTDLDGEQKSFAKMIVGSGKHLLSIVNDVLDFSSIEKGAMAIHSAPLVVAELIDSSEQAVLKSAMEKGISLQSVIDPGIPEQILGDDQRIRQILINLLANAVKFTSSGSVTLRVAPAAEGGRQFLDFFVEDTGIGISPETTKILFNPFTQADMKMNRTFGGTGLGLAISQRLAEAMDGKITVISAPGKGSTFTFRLPIKKTASYEKDVTSPSPPTRGAQSIAREGVLPGTGENLLKPVLVVEDDKTNSMLAGKMLQSLGYQVEFADDGAEALDVFSPEKYSAILMDIQMPVMNGIEAAGKIRKLESGTRVPIIALTAKVMPGDRDRCLAAGMDDFLSKPFKKDELAAKLARACPPE